MLVIFHHFEGTREKDNVQAFHVNTATVNAGLFTRMDQIILQPQVRLPFPRMLSPKLLRRAKLKISGLSPIGTLLAHPHFQMLLKIHKRQTIGGKKKGKTRVWIVHAYRGPK